jgi:carbonic anhydrase
MDQLLRNAERYAARFDKGDLPLPPALGLAIVACMDARLNPYALLGLKEGDAHLIRNAGGLVTDDTIRSLTISQRRLGTRAVMLLHHTDCGMQSVDDAAFRRELEAETGVAPPWAAEAEDVRRSLARVRESPFLPHRDAVRGFVYEVETGRLREVT